jgi:hypothetical protein
MCKNKNIAPVHGFWDWLLGGGGGVVKNNSGVWGG